MDNSFQRLIEQGSDDPGHHIKETSAQVEKLLADITKECESFEKTVTAELETARRQQMSPEHIKKLETQVKSVQELNAETLKGLNVRLKQAREREKQQADAEAAAIADRAAQLRESMKEEMRGAWIASGGDLADFEEAWPGLYQAEMTRRAQELYANTHKGTVRSIRDF